MDSLIEVRAQKYGVPIHYKVAGDTLNIDPVVALTIFHPTPAFVSNAKKHASDINNSSLVLRCTYYNQTILMTGDAEIPAERSMLLYGDLLQSRVLKCAHHGSNTASDSLFRRVVNADFGIVSVAKFNRFGLPDRELLQRYEQDGTQILKTSEHGAIQFHAFSHQMKRIR
jgi:competence protein ComEC